jgi:predicted ATPase
LLKGGSRDAPERHQTLRQAIAWSYDILPENEKILFEALSVFVGGGNLEAIEVICSEVCSPGYDILDGLQALVDKSLIRRVDDDYEEARFIMLETIREFAELLNKSKIL